ncbi:MAG: hypothetical protein C0602_11420 [Denitrovibrio sp.]|nr:MAG: hypothetical protein C0602_11420 [Denitrovibrio sp.]
MPIVNIDGAFDLHIHTKPSLFNRTLNDIDMAKHAAESGLRGILVKNHFESTVGRAELADYVVDGTRVFGGLVLNRFAGGINPVAVENALGLGAKEIWMPTVDAKQHCDVFGGCGGYSYQKTDANVVHEPVSVLGEDGALTQDAKDVLTLVKEADVILGTAHISKEEVFLLAQFAKDIDFKKLLITHPYFDPPKLNIDEQRALVDLGATLELCAGNIYPIPGTARLDDYLATIEALGVKNLIIASDAGQPRKSMPAEVIRVFTQCLMEKGVTQEMIDMMIKINPAVLLGLE